MLNLSIGNSAFARGAALIILPLFVSSCGGSSSDPAPEEPPVLPSMIANTANKDLAGCTIGDSCNATVLSGVVTKVDAAGDAEIRFVTITDNLNSTYTYDDGERQLVFDFIDIDIVNSIVYFEGPDGQLALEVLTNEYSGIGGGLAISPDEFFVGVAGNHTDASAIPLDGTADYVGSGFISTGFSGEADVSSTLTVDFGAGSADLVADTFVNSTIVDFDSMESRNMTIDGYTFYGDEVVLLNGINEVDITGANTEAAGAGLFYGPTSGGNPSEFGAIATIYGDDDAVLLVTEGQLVAP